MENIYLSVKKYLDHLTNYYQLGTHDQKNTVKQPNEVSCNFIQQLKSQSDLTKKIELVKALPDLDNEVLKFKKKMLVDLIIDLNILDITNDCLTRLSSEKKYEVLVKSHLKSHLKLETQFNKLYNDSFTIYKLDNNIYSLELCTDIEISCKDIYNTYYHYVPDDIKGQLILWNMNITCDNYKILKEYDSSDDEDGDVDIAQVIKDSFNFDNRQQIKTYPFTSKIMFMNILEEIHGDGYLPW